MQVLTKNTKQTEVEIRHVNQQLPLFYFIFIILSGLVFSSGYIYTGEGITK